MFFNKYLSHAILAVTCLLVLSDHVHAVNRLGKAQIEQRLDYLVGAKSFSPQAPLSQQRLMELVVDLAGWGKLPAQYRTSNDRPISGWDAYITRRQMRAFTKDYLGRDLTL